MSERFARLTEPLFYCPSLNATDEVILTGDEAHHVTVQRLRMGDSIALFDGHGEVVRGIIKKIDRTAVHVHVEQRTKQPPHAPQIELYSALPKGDRLNMLLDMSTQLGMNRFTPLRWQRSITEPGARYESFYTATLAAQYHGTRRAGSRKMAPHLYGSM